MGSKKQSLIGSYFAAKSQPESQASPDVKENIFARSKTPSKPAVRSVDQVDPGGSQALTPETPLLSSNVQVQPSTVPFEPAKINVIGPVKDESGMPAAKRVCRRIADSDEDDQGSVSKGALATAMASTASRSEVKSERARPTSVKDVVSDDESDDDSTNDERLIDEDKGRSEDQLEEIAVAALPIKSKKLKTKGKKDGDAFPIYNPLTESEWPFGTDMPYLYLSRLFHELEAESGRLRNINSITNFLRSVIAKAPKALVSTIYLAINKFGPDYEGLEIGVGDGLLLKVLAQSTGRSTKQLSAELKQLGDLGEIAEKCRSSQKTIFPPAPLTVTKVLASFRKIAGEKGDRKINLIKQMLVASKESEARYLIRTFQGNLRIGCSIRTVLPSLARAVTLTPPLTDEERQQIDSLPASRFDRSLTLSESDLQSEIEASTSAVKRAWVECPNLDLLIPALLKYPISQLHEHCFLTPGVPIKCMLAAPAKSVGQVLNNFEGHDIVLEYKYDGERAQIHVLEDGTVSIFSRNAETSTDKYPDIVKFIPMAFKPGQVTSCILDAEVVAFDRVAHKIRPFQILSTRKRKDVKTDDIAVDICIFAFDLIFFNGRSLLSTPLKERRRLLHSSFIEVDDHFRFTISKESTDEMEITTFLDESITENCEGLMVKCLSGPLSLYEPDKRSHAWRKLKKDYMEGLTDSFDLIPIGAYYGKGKRTGNFGGYLLAVYDQETEELQSICKIGSGFSDEMLASLTEYARQHLVEAPRSYYRYPESKDVPDEWLDGSQVWEVKAADLSISPVHKAAIGLVQADKGIALRFPRFIQVRPDKKPEDATSSSEIADFYNSQNNKQ